MTKTNEHNACPSHMFMYTDVFGSFHNVNNKFFMFNDNFIIGAFTQNTI